MTLRVLMVFAVAVVLTAPAFAADPTADRIADLEAKLKTQAEKIDRLETMLGVKAPAVTTTATSATAVSNFTGYTATQGATYSTGGACANGQCASGNCSAPQQRGFGLGFHFFRR